MRIWVTRTEGEATAAKLRAMGHAPLVGPVLESRVLAAPLELKGVTALAFTSANGVRAFARRCPRRDLRVFTVGEGTAAAAREAGFREVESADGDVEALARLIWRRRPGLVLHPSAREPAKDLARMLVLKGVQAFSCPIYETAPLPLPDAVAAALGAVPPELDAVMLHSPRGAERVAELIGARGGAPDLDAFCISRAAAAPLKRLRLKAVHVAEFPNEASLLKLLEP